MNPTLDIIIINWNSGKLLQSCLQSIIKTKKENFLLSKVIVVDNASQDASIDNLDKINLPIMLIRNDKNFGFAAACNQGARGSQADYLLFLNPDTKLSDNSLEYSIAFMEQPENKKVGIVGVQLVDDSGHVARTCARFPTPGGFLTRIFGLDKLLPGIFPSHFMNEWPHNETGIVDQVMGAFFLVRRSVFESLRGFDERFFVYFEELDFSLRTHQAGGKSVYLATAQVYHGGGGSTSQILARRLFFSLRSRILYCYKHFGWWAATAVAIGTLLVEPFTRLIWGGSRGSKREVFDTLQAYTLLWRAALELLAKKQLASNKI